MSFAFTYIKNKINVCLLQFMNKESHLKYKNFIKNVKSCGKRQRDVLLTISHVTMKTFYVLLPFIPYCSSGHVMGSKYLLVT